MEAQNNLPSASRTKSDLALLKSKAESIIDFLWGTTDPTMMKGNDDPQNTERFRPHREYLLQHRTELLDHVPDKLKVLHLGTMTDFDGFGWDIFQ